MPEKSERFIKAVYKDWKAAQPKDGAHPDEEALACFLEGRLSPEEGERIKEHLIHCANCADIFAVTLGLKDAQAKVVPEELLGRVKELLAPPDKSSLLEIVLKLKGKLLELLSTTGDVLVGQELVPAPVLRSRSLKDFKDEVNILRDFKDIRVEAKIENKGGAAFNLTIVVKQKQTQKIIKDLRVTLLKDDVELESYLTDAGAVTFEHILLGKYKVEISTVEDKVASVLLDIRV